MLDTLANLDRARDTVADKVTELHREVGPVLDQAVRWKPVRWRGEVLGQLADCLGSVADVSLPHTSDELLIRRRDVAGIDGLEARFLAAMVWGFGLRGYGPARVGAIAHDGGPRLVPSLKGICDAALVGPADAWDAFTRCHKLKGLGPAFATKVAYFASVARGRLDRGPLIADLNTSWAMWDLVRLPRSVERFDSYVAYIDLAHQWAEEIGCRPDDVERALFEIGKTSTRTLN